MGFEKTPFQGFVQAVPEERSSRSSLGFRLREAALSPFVLGDAHICGIRGLGAGAFMVR